MFGHVFRAQIDLGSICRGLALTKGQAKRTGTEVLEIVEVAQEDCLLGGMPALVLSSFLR